MEPPPPVGYGYSPFKVALFYIAPMVCTAALVHCASLTRLQLASIIGQLFGHRFNDLIVDKQLLKSKGVFEPEVRLWTLWISIAFLIGSLVFIGFAFERKLPWIAIVIAWAMYTFGIVTLTVAITGN